MISGIDSAEVLETARFVAARQRDIPAPRVAMVTGSGLSALADRIEVGAAIHYGELPHWPSSTVEGHPGRLILGRLGGVPVVVAAGRAHLYEGYKPAEVGFPTAVMAALGASVLILTNAAGAIHPGYRPGDVMVFRDHISLPGLTGSNPLVGRNDEALGPRFPLLAAAYDGPLREAFEKAARKRGLTAHAGVYAMVVGPSYETAAEVRLLSMLGADAVGMSTVPEVTVARHRGMRVLAVSLITNVAGNAGESAGGNSGPSQGATGVGEEPAGHAEVLEVGHRMAPRLAAVLEEVVRQVAQAEKEG